MQTSAELKNLLQRIDHKGYPHIRTQGGLMSSLDMCFPLTMCREIRLQHRRR